jgi:hypothetical protein
VPHWLDSTATGETTPTRIIRFDHLPHSDVWGTNLGEKLKGMHWRTYECLCRIHGAAQARSMIGLMGFVKRLGTRRAHVRFRG